VLFMLLRGGSSASASGGAVSTGPSEALQAAQLQASTQNALGQQQVDAANSAGAMELQAFMYCKDSDLQLANIQAGVAGQQIAAQSQTDLANIGAQRDVAISNNQLQQYAVGQQFAYMTNQTNANFDFLALQASTQRDVDVARIGADERTA